ncbi:hypothetical protein [Haemophilus pittmaniae]|uniref:hypothetical protein n=1 Tax=Haemophilus pittmaniae TaxID=249188 RepID=UPI0028DCB481|nr:hypothetical protein [Haemophilus pittmaniae]
MAKTPTTIDNNLVYKIGMEIAELQANVKGLKHKPLKITIPKKPKKYADYSISAEAELPVGYRNMLCLKVYGDEGAPKYIRTTDTLSDYADSYVDTVYYLVPLFSLSEMVENSETIRVELNKNQMAEIDKTAEERERQEREQRERQEREQRERQEREQRNKKAYKTNFAYWALVDYAMTKYAQDLSDYARLEFDNGEELRANKNGLERFLAHPFVKVKNNTAQDDNYQDYLSNTPAIIADLKAKLPEYQAMQDNYVAGTLSFDDMPKVSGPTNYIFDEL